MSIQTSLNINNQTAFLKGSFKSTDGTYEQNASETVAVAKYTVLGKVLFALGTPVLTGTGNGTVTAFSISGTPKIGNYTLDFSAALVADLYDPEGNLLLKSIALTDGGATVITAGGITFTVNDGATAYAADSLWTIPVEAGSGKVKALKSDATDGSQFPYSIINEAIAAADIVAGDVDVMEQVIGGDGVVNEDDVVFHNGSDTLDTQIGGKPIRTYFEEKGLFFKQVTDFTEYENA